MQEEIDEVVDEGRKPEFEDLERLQTERAVVEEVLRWRPVTAGGIPHMTTRDDVYEGFWIPKGTNVHANQWLVTHFAALFCCLIQIELKTPRAIHRDPELYPDPDSFNPARWLEPAYPTYCEPLSTYPNLQNISAFSFGRRICPGLNIAERLLNIVVVRLAGRGMKRLGS